MVRYAITLLRDVSWGLQRQRYGGVGPLAAEIDFVRNGFEELFFSRFRGFLVTWFQVLLRSVSARGGQRGGRGRRWVGGIGRFRRGRSKGLGLRKKTSE